MRYDRSITIRLRSDTLDDIHACVGDPTLPWESPQDLCREAIDDKLLLASQMRQSADGKAMRLSVLLRIARRSDELHDQVIEILEIYGRNSVLPIGRIAALSAIHDALSAQPSSQYRENIARWLLDSTALAETVRFVGENGTPDETRQAEDILLKLEALAE